MPNVTEAFIRYLFEKASAINPEITEQARRCKEDYIAVASAGAAKNREKWEELIRHCSEGKARIIGDSRRVNSQTAALINGFNAHSLELDDGQRFAMIHLGACVISAIEAAAADYEISEENYIKGIIMGYEAACRLSIAMQPAHKQKGYHTAGTCGTVGAAAGVGFALGMNQNQMKRVLTLAAGSAAGMLEIQEQESEVKPYNLGRAAMDGLTAACMGFTPFATPEDMLGGERGFFATFSDSRDYDKLTEAQEYFEIQRIYMKPYASCRHSHSAVEAALHLRERIRGREISHILVETYRLGVKGHDHTQIKGIASAKLSTPYAVAAALLFGRADLSVFEPLREEALKLAAKVSVVENEELTAQSSRKRVAVLRITFPDGSAETERVEYAKGDPENPMSSGELEEKWKALYQYAEGCKVLK